MTKNEFIEKYSSDNFESYVIENATVDYWNDLIKTYKLEKLNFVFPEAMFLSISHEIKEGKSLLGKEFDEFCERQIEILNIKQQYEPQQTEFDLTIENLLKCGFNEQEAIKFFNFTGNHILQCTNGKFYFSKHENKFYTGIDFHRKYYFERDYIYFPLKCPDLVPDYYNLSLHNFLDKQKNSLGLLYNEVNQTKKFIYNEIKRSNDIIENAKESFVKRTRHKFESKDLIVNVYESYIYFLEAKDTVAINLNNTSTNNYLGQPTNENANLFFEFLCEHYRPEDKTQVKYVNILYYLKNDAEKKYFIYKVKQKDYKKLIESKGIKISKFDKSVNYLEVEKPIFYTLENTFLKNKTV